MKFRLFSVFVVILLILTALTGCGSKDKAAILNGKTISRKEFDKELTKMQKVLKASGSKVDEKMKKELKNQVLEQILLRTIEMQEAKKRNLMASDKIVEEKMQEIKKSYKEFDKFLKEQDMTEEDLKDQILYQLTREALFNDVTKDAKVDDSAIKDYYNQNRKEFGKKSLNQVKDQISAKLVQIQKASVYNDFLLNARQKAEVKNLLEEK